LFKLKIIAKNKNMRVLGQVLDVGHLPIKVVAVLGMDGNGKQLDQEFGIGTWQLTCGWWFYG
jgi:hypothetical protein